MGATEMKKGFGGRQYSWMHRDPEPLQEGSADSSGPPSELQLSGNAARTGSSTCHHNLEEDRAEVDSLEDAELASLGVHTHEVHMPEPRPAAKARR